MDTADFHRAALLFGRDAKITAYLQGGLSVTGTWTYHGRTDRGEGWQTAIVLKDGNGTRTVAPIASITALREVSVPAPTKSPNDGLSAADLAGWTKRGRALPSRVHPGF